MDFTMILLLVQMFFWDCHRSIFLEPFAEPKDEPQRSGPGIPQGTG